DPLVTGVQTCALPILYRTKAVATPSTHRQTAVITRSDRRARSASATAGGRTPAPRAHARTPPAPPPPRGPRGRDGWRARAPPDQIGRASCRERGGAGV